MWLFILVIVVVCGAAYWFWMSQQSEPDDLAAGDDDDDDDASQETTQSIMDKASLLAAVQKYGTKVAVAGESHANEDGTPRRRIIAKLDVGDMVALVREPRNRFDANAVKVRSVKGDIGYVNREQAPEIAGWIDAGEKLAAYITSICGGPEEGVKDYGVWLIVVSLDHLKRQAKRGG